MKQIKDLVSWFSGKEKALVALSGGVDSALVACAAQIALGKQDCCCDCGLQDIVSRRIRLCKKSLSRNRN